MQPILIIAVAGIIFGFAPLLFEHFRNMWARPEYQYFPFAIAATAILLWQRGKAAAGVYDIAQSKRTTWIAAMVIAWLLLAAAVFFHAPLLAAAGAVIALACAMSVFFAEGQVTNKWGIWALLWLLVPLPLGIDRGLTTYLQALSSRLSSGLLDLMGIDHAMSANVLQLPSKELFVDEACSGVVSVMSVITCGAIWAVWKNRSLLHALLLIVSGVVWALFLNVARICIITAAEAWFQTDWSTGTAHDVLGLTLFFGTFLALVSTDQLLLFLLAPIEMDAFWAQHAGQNWVVDAWNRFVRALTPNADRTPPSVSTVQRVSSLAIAPGLAFALLGLWQLPGLFARSHWEASVQLANTVDAESLPETIEPWQRVEFQEAARDRFRGFADHSNVFIYQLGENGPLATFSLDYPFTGRWHDLDNCYTSAGWTQTNLVNKPGRSEEDWEFVESEFEKPDGTTGYLVYSFFDGDGTKMQPPTKASVIGPIVERMMESGAASGSRRLFQVQVFLGGTGVIDESSKAAAETLFLEAREILRQKMEVGASVGR